MCDDCDCYKHYPLLRLEAKHFVAGIILRYPRPNILASIVDYMKYWDSNRIKDYCQRKGWEVNIL